MDNKNILRQKYKKLRDSLLYEEISKKSDLIIEKLSYYIEKNNFNNIMIFMNMNSEVQITKLINKYPNKKFYIPKIFQNREMKINLYNESELVFHKFGFYESISKNYIDETILDLIIVPGLIFDLEKNRIGFGGGYYDTFLDKLTKKNHNTLNIAVCYDFQLIKSIPSEPFDIKPHIIITDKRVID